MMNERNYKQGLLKSVLMLITVFYMTTPLWSNNLRLNGMVKVTDVSSGVATLEVDLSWDNSWRDEFNWDGVWVFLKYKPASGSWSSVLLQDAGHSATNGYEVMLGKSGSNVTGVFVYPGTAGVVRRASTKLTLKWACGSGYTKSSFDNNDVFLLAQGIEMVYIPYGAYYLGDEYSRDCLSDAEGHPLIIDSEDSRTLYQRSQDSSVSVAVSDLPASYPKGYQGYYIMKYELSQEQYVRFLNTLTKGEQESLLGASFLANLGVGRYVFGDTLQPSFRNGIVLRSKPSGRSYIFDHDLNGNGVYGEDGDGQCIACNYMSVNDLLAYASWSGLRPMSELEYERACRAAFPQEPQRGEYAWNTSGHISSVTSLLASGKESEVPTTSANVNSDNGLGLHCGPVRCGAFAGENNTQIESGGSYWGVMEMSGNVGELVASVSNTGLSKTLNGNGSFSLTGWSSNASHYGIRGGSFSGEDSLLRISDRTQMSGYVASLTKRDSTVGCRLVQTLNTGGITIDPGAISLEGPLCPSITNTVRETGVASISGISGNFPLSYTWSYSKDNGSTWTVLAGETGNALRFDSFEAGKTYLFKRTAICALGEASAQTTTGITAMASTVITSLSREETASCDVSFTVSATGAALTYQWQQDGVDISGATTTTYLANSDGEYRCKVNGTCGTVISEVQTISSLLPNDGILVDSRDGKRYKTRLMADGHVWMIEDLRFGTCNASTFNSYYKGSIQNQIAPGYWGVCIASPQLGAGYLYNWQAAMNSESVKFNGGNPSGNVDGNSPTQWQGICPDGWHIPSGGSTGEFQQLYIALGSTVSRIYPGCSDFRGVLGGYAKESSVQSTASGYYWSSTYGTNVAAYVLYFYRGSTTLQTHLVTYCGSAVRCVKNY